jgi:hypothetical protein
MSYYKIKCGGIYIIEISDYYYVGKSTDVFMRWSQHYMALKLGKHHSPKLQEKFNEIGIVGATFRVLEYISITDFRKTCESKGKALNSAYNRYLLMKEKEWMSRYSKNWCLNNYDKWFS